MSNYSPSNYVLAAILGNWQGESGVNPGIWEGLIVPPGANPWEYQHTNNPSTGGYGLGQWTNVGTTHGRCYNVWYYLTSNGYATDDGYGECEFLEIEAYWTPSSLSNYHYQTFSDFMNSSATNVSYLTEDYMRCWEGIYTSDIANRRTYAANWYNYLDSNDATWRTETQQPSWYAGNYFTSTSQQENNAKAAWWYFNMGGSPGPGPGPTPGIFPHLWLMFAFCKKIPKGYRKIRGN